MGFAYHDRIFVAKAVGKPTLTEAQMERSNSEEREQTGRPQVPEVDEPAREPAPSPEAFQSDDWRSSTAPTSDWAEAVAGAEGAEIAQRKASGPAHVWLCGRDTLVPF